MQTTKTAAFQINGRLVTKGLNGARRTADKSRLTRSDNAAAEQATLAITAAQAHHNIGV